MKDDLPLCNRSACRAESATWWNTSTLAYYCEKCAKGINEGAGTHIHGVQLCVPPHRLPTREPPAPCAKPMSGAERTQRRVVCSAVSKDGQLILGPRHFDPTMQWQLAKYKGWHWHDAEQGFIDQWGKFMTREEAFEVANTAGQIRVKTGNPSSRKLFSEDLY